jgi:hypothetical protein
VKRGDLPGSDFALNPESSASGTQAVPPQGLLNEIRRARRRWIAPTLLLGATAALALFARMLIVTISSKKDITFPESQVVERVIAAADGRPLYDDWRQWPHHFAPYGPLQYYPTAMVMRVFGDRTDTQAFFTVGRSNSLICLAGIFVVLWLVGRQIGLAPIWAFAALPLTLHWTSLLQYVVSFRPDAPAAFWALLALLVSFRGPARGGRTIAALIFLYLSMWYKPTALGMVVVIGLWIVRSRGARRAAAILSVWVLSGLIPLLLFDRFCGGRVLLNLVTSLDNGWSTAVFRHYCIDRAHNPFMVQMVLAVVIAGVGLLRADSSPKLKILWWAYLYNLAACLVQLFKYGSDKNYFLIPFLLSSVIVIHGVMVLWRGEAPRMRPALQELCVWITMIPYAFWVMITFLALTPLVGKTIRMTTDPYPIETEARMWEGLLLTDNPYVALKSQSPPTLMDVVQYQALVRRGYIDPEPMLKTVRERRFTRIVLLTALLPQPGVEPSRDGPLICEGFVEALGESYREVGRVTDFSIFMPANISESPR